MTNSHWYKLIIGLIYSITPNHFGYTYITSEIQEFTVQGMGHILKSQNEYHIRYTNKHWIFAS